MSSVPDFTEAEQWAVETTLKERWPEKDLEIQLADVEIKMYPQDRELTVCPAIFWDVGSTGFVIIKAAERTYRSPFYYRGFSTVQHRQSRIRRHNRLRCNHAAGSRGQGSKRP